MTTVGEARFLESVPRSLHELQKAITGAVADRPAYENRLRDELAIGLAPLAFTHAPQRRGGEDGDAARARLLWQWVDEVMKARGGRP